MGKCALCSNLRRIQQCGSVTTLCPYHVCGEYNEYTIVGSVSYAHISGDYNNGEVYTTPIFAGNTMNLSLRVIRNISKIISLISFANHKIIHLNQFLIIFVPVEVLWYSHQQYSCSNKVFVYFTEIGYINCPVAYTIKHACNHGNSVYQNVLLTVLRLPLGEHPTQSYFCMSITRSYWNSINKNGMHIPTIHRPQLNDGNVSLINTIHSTTCYPRKPHLRWWHSPNIELCSIQTCIN